MQWKVKTFTIRSMINVNEMYEIKEKEEERRKKRRDRPY